MIKRTVIFFLVSCLSLLVLSFAQSPRLTALKADIEEFSQPASGHLGVAAALLETGETFSINGAEHFPMQSVGKLPISMAALKQVDAGKLKLDQRIAISRHDVVPEPAHSTIREQHPTGTHLTVEELLQATISESDGTASDVLLRLVGGPGAVVDYLHSLDVQGIAVENFEREIAQNESLLYENWSTPEQMILLLITLQENRALSTESSRRLLRLMTLTHGASIRIRGDLRPGTPVAHKTATSGLVNGVTAATNDVGIVTMPNGRHVAMAIFISDSSSDVVTRDSVIARIARRIVDYYWGL